MRDAFGREISNADVENWRIPGLWWLEEGGDHEISESRTVPGVTQLDDRYWGRIAKIASDWRIESQERHIGDSITSSHLQLGLSQERVTSELEVLLRNNFKILEWICELPETEIRLEDLKQPIDRSRRMAKRALADLASHSEDWLRVTKRGPIPKHITSSIREEELAIYENRLVRTLIDRSVFHLGRLIEAVIRDEKAKNDLRGTTENFRKEERIFGSVGVESTSESISQIAERRERLEELRDSIRALKQSTLGIATNEVQGVTELHVTNLLANEQRYREMVPIWEALRRYEGSGERGDATLTELWLSRQADLAAYLHLLVARSLQFLGASEIAPNVWRLVGVNIHLQHNEGSCKVALSRNEYDIDQFVVGILGVSLGIDAEDRVDVESIEELIAFFSRSSKLDNRRKVLLHLSYPDDVSVAMQPLVLTNAFEPASGSRSWFAEGGLMPLAVHPLSLDSAERLGRIFGESIRRYWAKTQELAIHLPDEFQSVPSEDFDLDGSGFELSGRVLRATTWNFKPPVLTKKTKEFSKVNLDYRSLNASLRAIVTDLEAVKDEVFACPVRPHDHPASGHDIVFWNETGFELRCNSCEVRWGIRVCTNCGSKNPTHNPATDQDWEFVELDQSVTPSKYFGLELWADYCEKSHEVFVCADCAVCPRSQTESSCQRCSRRR